MGDDRARDGFNNVTLNGTGSFGGAGAPLNPALIQGGHCTGRFTSAA